MRAPNHLPRLHEDARIQVTCSLAASILFLGLAAGIANADPTTPILSFSPPPYVTHLVRLASPGDVNGDGKDDLLVGTYSTGANSNPGGRALLYFGGAPFDTIPDLSLDSDGFLFGVAEGPTDLNGDGWPDIVVAGVGGNGVVRIFFGGPKLDDVPDVVIQCPGLSHNAFGQSLEGTLDLNGDGFQDLAVGWPTFIDASDGSYLGRVVVYFGGPLLDDVPDVILSDPVASREYGFCFFGEYVHSAGDFDGDGWPDLGVYQRMCEFFGPGLTFIYRGGPAFGTSPIATLPVSKVVWPLPRAWAFAPFGGSERTAARSIVATGHKIVVDGPEQSLRQGLLWLYEGTDSGGDRSPDQVIEDAWSLSGPLWADADLTGDGRRDLIIGGTRLLLYSTPRLDLPPDLELQGSSPARNFGYWVTAVDLNGDGVDELVVTEPGPFVGPVGATGSRVHAFDLSQPLRARAFVLGGKRVIPLGNTSSTVSVQFEPVDADYSNRDVDIASLELRSESAGDAGPISANTAKVVVEADTDQNGVSELRGLFAAADLSRLLGSIRGRQEVPVALGGRLHNGRKFRAPLTLTVLGTGKLEQIMAAVSPNPMNPSAVITMEISEGGPVTARLYDVSGRVVRTILSAVRLPAGTHRLPIDGQDDHGRRLSSGIYFYSIRTPAGTASGRLVVAK